MCTAMEVGSVVAAVVSLAAERSESGVLERVVQVARDLTGAQYGAALLTGPDGAPSVLAHAGMTPAQIAVLPHLPRPVGLIGVALRGETVNVPDLALHPDSVGFPSGHVPMAAFLGVPITTAGAVLGGLYLTQPPGDGVFSEADEQTMQALAEQAGVVVQGLRSQHAAEAVIGRLGVASWHVSGNQPGQYDHGESDHGEAVGAHPVIRRLLAAARDVLGTDLTFLSQTHHTQQTFTHVDSSPGAPPLVEGTIIDAAGGYCSTMLHGDIPNAVADVRAHPVLGPMPVTAALGVGAYCGVPVRLPDGTAHGTLCGLSSSAGPAPSTTQLEALRTIAGLIGASLAEQHQHERDRAAQAAAFTSMTGEEHRAVYLQPIVDLRTRKPVGFEALTRFSTRHGAPRRPDDVFAHAAHLGLGPQLERAAVRGALQCLPELTANTYLSVNLSPQALLEAATFDLLTSAVRRAPHSIVVELTEHDRVRDYPALLGVLRGLRERGLRLAIDDTGSGFASLQHVTRMQPDIVKLDIAFVRDLHRDPSRRAVARALVGFATDIGASLVAEGIETRDELDELLRLGAPFGQGYHLGRPAPAADTLSTAKANDEASARTTTSTRHTVSTANTCAS